jgi:hypothetical protein
MAQRVDLTRYPVVIELYPKDGKEFIELQSVGADRAKIANMGIRECVDYVMKHYNKGSVANMINEEIKEALTAEKYAIFNIFNHAVGIDFHPETKQVVADHTNEPINDSRYFMETPDEANNTYWLCEIRVYPEPDPLGGLEAVLR